MTTTLERLYTTQGIVEKQARKEKANWSKQQQHAEQKQQQHAEQKQQQHAEQKQRQQQEEGVGSVWLTEDEVEALVGQILPRLVKRGEELGQVIQDAKTLQVCHV